MAEPTKSVAPLGRLAIFRAIALTVVLLISWLQAAPGEPLKAEQMALPINARPIAALSGALGALGISWSADAITEDILWSSRQLTGLRRALVRPFMPLLDKLGMGQRWRLFTLRGRHAYRIQAEVLLADQSWHLVYRAHELDELALAPRLTHRRLRGIYNPHSHDEAREQYEPLVNWVANGILAEHPEYLGVRISMERLLLGSREKPTEVTSITHPIEVYRAGTP